MAAETSPLLLAAARFRAALLRAERQAAARLVRAYGTAYQRLQGDIEALLAAIAALESPTWGQVQRLSLYRALLAAIEDQVGRYAIIAENEIAQGVEASITAALRDSQRLVAAALPGFDPVRLRAAWATLNPEAVMAMAGFLGDDSPLYVSLRRLGADVAAIVADHLRDGIVLGYNPRKVARLIRDSTGQGLTWSLNTARTANLWAYRTANHASYQANSHVVEGWVWWAELGSGRTCLSCVNMHGSLHPLDEVLNDHHSGRCTPLPQTRSYRELGLDVAEERPAITTGEAWFRGLPAAEQRAIMGPAMYDAWKAGQFTFADLSAAYTDDVYGPMLREASLKGLLGERAKAYYSR